MGFRIMLARFAENSFWLARYIERSENLSRILDVHDTFARDIKGKQDWLPIVQMQADDDIFFSLFDNANKENVLHFYILETKNPSSIISSIRTARENARGLRHLISTEMWVQLNVFYKNLCLINENTLSHTELNKTLSFIKRECQLHDGITKGTVYRDETHIFYSIGKMIERADMTSRLLDLKYHRLLPSLDDVGSIIDVNQWNILLRSVSGYHAYRRAYTGKTTVASVIGFMLFNPHFVRSFVFCLNEIIENLERLRLLHNQKELSKPLKLAKELSLFVAEKNAGEIIISGLHEFLDDMQKRLIVLNQSFYEVYFVM